MKNYTYSLLILFLGLSLTTCKNDQVTPDPSACNCQYVKEAKDYFAFKVGSWWVYEEETSLERDSVYVTQASISEEGGYNFDVRTYSSREGYYYHYWPLYISQLSGCKTDFPVTKRCLFVKRAKYKPGIEVIGDYNCFYIKYKQGEYISTGSDLDYCPNNHLGPDRIFDSLLVNDTISRKTIKMHETCNFIDGKQPVNYYYSKGIGIIRKELIDSNQVWNLVNYYIQP